MNARTVTTDVLLGMVPIALLVGLWQALASFGYASPSLLPPPGLVFMRLAQQLFTSAFQHEIGATLFRLFAGFSIAVILGVGLGLAAATSVILDSWPKPSSNSSAGYSATLGSGANTRTIGRTTALTAGLAAAASPMPTPRTTAIENPANSRNRVIPTAC